MAAMMKGMGLGDFCVDGGLSDDALLKELGGPSKVGGGDSVDDILRGLNIDPNKADDYLDDDAILAELDAATDPLTQIREMTE